MQKILIWLYIWFLKNMYGYTKVSTKLLYAQAWHETGNFNSAVFKQNKNLFGMRLPSVRKTYATGSNLNHATYKNHFDSVRDYFERQKYFRISNTDDTDFQIQTISSNYAEDTEYLIKWNTVNSTIKMPVTNFWIFASLFFLVLIIIMIFKKIKNA